MECGTWIVERGRQMENGFGLKKKGCMFVENVENFHEIFFTLLAAIISWLLYFLCYKVDIISGRFRDHSRDHGKGRPGSAYHMTSLWFWEGLDRIIVTTILDKMAETTQMLSFHELFFNVDNGYLEGLVRGFRSGVLSQSDYLNLSQCETLEGKPWERTELACDGNRKVTLLS